MNLKYFFIVLSLVYLYILIFIFVGVQLGKYACRYVEMLGFLHDLKSHL